MWQQLLERFVPLMDGDVSTLDRRDGVARSTGLVLNGSVHPSDATAIGQQGRAAYEGSISPLTS
jgi:hypothetical protein